MTSIVRPLRLARKMAKKEIREWQLKAKGGPLTRILSYPTFASPYKEKLANQVHPELYRVQHLKMQHL